MRREHEIRGDAEVPAAAATASPEEIDVVRRVADAQFSICGHDLQRRRLSAVVPKRRDE